MSELKKFVKGMPSSEIDMSLLRTDILDMQKYINQLEEENRKLINDLKDQHNHWTKIMNEKDEEIEKLREAYNAAKAFIEANKDDPDIADIYDRYAKAQEALEKGKYYGGITY